MYSLDIRIQNLVDLRFGNDSGEETLLFEHMYT